MPDGTIVLAGARSKRGKMRGPPGSRNWNTALKSMVSILKIAYFWNIFRSLCFVENLFNILVKFSIKLAYTFSGTYEKFWKLDNPKNNNIWKKKLRVTTYSSISWSGVWIGTPRREWLPLKLWSISGCDGDCPAHPSERPRPPWGRQIPETGQADRERPTRTTTNVSRR